MTRWISADHHFFHKQILTHEPMTRPFKTLDLMHMALIENHNNLVGENDDVYLAGDIIMSDNFQDALSILNQLNGKHLYIIPGSHDHEWIDGLLKSSLLGTFGLCWKEGNYPWKITILPPIHTIKHMKHKIVICHYPILSWQQKKYGAIHLHGHSHGHLKHPSALAMDIGVDCFNLCPVNLDWIVENAPAPDGGKW